jgi:phosphate acyltransferase
VNENIIIALDAMGGDHAPDSVIRGACCCAQKSLYPNVEFLFFGDQEVITQLIAIYDVGNTKLKYKIIHCDKVIKADEKPSVALRQGKESSMWHAVSAVQQKQANAAVSAGNTGALMAISKLILRSLPDIHRPAIAGIMPTLKGNIAMLDLGANAECTAENLFQFAVMGDAFAKVMLQLTEPKIALLNIGSEEVKGNDVIRLAASLIKESALPLNFIGYIEGNNISEGVADVVVADGFSGNVALKTAEGIVKFCQEIISKSFKSSLMAKIGYLFARGALKASAKKLDHRLYNGAMFLGLNGIVVKSHGSADHISFANAIAVAIELARNNINEKIINELEVAQNLVTENLKG